MTAKLHFPGLNALRFYAASAVIFSHLDQNVRPFPGLSRVLRFFLIDPHSAVSLFFVLSGFLITYLLLREQDITGTVSVKQFYLRRILRIWPLYYLIALIGFALFPSIFGKDYLMTMLYAEPTSTVMSVAEKILLVLLLLPNFSGISAPMGHLWSIGVEEQYYAFWPWVFRFKLDLIKVAAGVLIIKFLIAPLIPAFGITGMTKIFNESRFECMAVGAIGAYLYFHNSRFLSFIYRPFVQVLALASILLMASRGVPVNVYNSTVISIIFIIIILNLATNNKTLVQFEHPILDRLGQISYGLYLYHFPVLYLFLIGAPKLGLVQQTNLLQPFIFFSVLLGTWLISEVSYRWYETPFLRLKEKHSALPSG